MPSTYKTKYINQPAHYALLLIAKAISEALNESVHFPQSRQSLRCLLTHRPILTKWNFSLLSFGPVHFRFKGFGAVLIIIEAFCKQTVETQIRRRVLRHMIWVFTVCIYPTKMTLLAFCMLRTRVFAIYEYLADYVWSSQVYHPEVHVCGTLCGTAAALDLRVVTEYAAIDSLVICPLKTILIDSR